MAYAGCSLVGNKVSYNSRSKSNRSIDGSGDRSSRRVELVGVETGKPAADSPRHRVVAVYVASAFQERTVNKAGDAMASATGMDGIALDVDKRERATWNSVNRRHG